MRRRSAWMGVVRVMFVVLLLGVVSMAAAQRGGKKAATPVSELTPEQKRARLDSLQRERRKVEEQRIKTIEGTRATGQNLNTIIERFENILRGPQCAAGKSDRCADAMFQLGQLYYDQARDAFVAASDNHAKEMERWDRAGGRGPVPPAPVPDYSKSLQMYWRLAREYPSFPRLPDVFFQMSNVYQLAGHLDTTRILLEQLIQRFPNSPRVSGSHFRLGELLFMDNQFSRAYDHFKRVRKDQMNPEAWEMNHFRLGECAYNVGDYDKAVEYFHNYVVEVDAGRYRRGDYRAIALEYMAIAFSDMPDGVQEAIKFFNRHKGKPYEADIIYMVGAKNRDHGQWDAAIMALTGALKKYPLFRDAPLARQQLIECYVVKKDLENANKQREILVDNYDVGSKWHNANRNEKKVIDESRVHIRRALGDIALHYHHLAQRQKRKELYDLAMKRYEEFFRRFPEDKWRNFEYRYNVAEIYSSIGNCEKAADYYNFVAMEDLSTYPAYVQDIDTLGMDPEELEKLRAQKGDKTSPIAISQEDAGYNAIVALDNCRKREIARDGIKEDQAYALPSTKRLIEQAMNFQRRFPQSENAPEVLYLIGSIHFDGKNYGEAINMFKTVVDQYPRSKIHKNAMRDLANSYSLNNQFDLAMQTYEALLRQTPQDTKEFGEISDLAAGAMYRNAESLKKAGNSQGALQAFMAIGNKFPNSRVSERGWFEAAVIYEELKDFDRAAQTFQELTSRFPRSTLRETAFVRAAENYKKMEKWAQAANVYWTAAQQIPKAEFAIPSLSNASEMYKRMDQYDMAGKMFEEIFERYRNDPQTPRALYNAGMLYEEGKLYERAIAAYELLVKNYKDNEYASEAAFSIGLCYEKLGDFARMANVFADYAKNFASDRAKQVQALVKAGDAYFNMQNFRDSEAAYNNAIRIYEQHGKTVDINPADVAQAYYRVGEIRYRTFENIKLEARNPRDLQARMREKQKALADIAPYFMKAIELGIEEWTMRATYMIGKSFYDMAEAFANQTLFGNEDERMAGKIQVFSGLDQFYTQAMRFFGQNIDWAKEQNLSGPHITMSMDALMEMAFKKGHILEEVGNLFKNAPIPRGLTEEEREMYEDELHSRWMMAREAAMPVYEQGMRLARDVGVQNEWVDKMRERLNDINPESDYINIEIVQWVPKKIEKQFDADGNEIIPRGRDREYDRAMQRIDNIMKSNNSVADKISQLNRIRMDAERNIKFEEGKIHELRQKRPAGS